MVDLPPEEAVTFRAKCIKAKSVSISPRLRYDAEGALQHLLRPPDRPLDNAPENPIPCLDRGQLHLRSLQGQLSIRLLIRKLAHVDL